MKLLRLSLHNIHSFDGHFTIDFSAEPLKDCGLFLITGPTGAGKSTLLDAITLALFKKTARLGDVSDSNLEDRGGIFSHLPGVTSCFSEVDYQVGETVYRSRFELSKTKTGKFRSYQMSLTNVTEGKAFSINRSKVPDKNSEIIGLDANQFLKSALLSQGDFADFLKAKEEEKSRLLENLTGGEVYRKIGARAFERKKLLKTSYESLEADLNRLNPLSDADIADLEGQVKSLKKENKEKKTFVEKLKQGALLDRQLQEVLLSLSKEKAKLPKLQKAKAESNLAMLEAKKALEKICFDKPARLKVFQTTREYDVQIHDLQNALDEQKAKLQERKSGLRNLQGNLEKMEREEANLKKELLSYQELEKGPDPAFALAEARPYEEHFLHLQGELATMSKRLNTPFTLNPKEGFTSSLQPFEARAKNASEKRLQDLEEEKETLRLESSLTEKRALLKKGKSCPLCGSLDHPFEGTSPETFSKKLKEVERAIQKEKDALLLLQLLKLAKGADASLSRLKEKVAPFSLEEIAHEGEACELLSKRASIHEKKKQAFNSYKERFQALNVEIAALKKTLEERCAYLEEEGKSLLYNQKHLDTLAMKRKELFGTKSPHKEEEVLRREEEHKRTTLHKLEKGLNDALYEEKEVLKSLERLSKEEKKLQKELAPLKNLDFSSLKDEEKTLEKKLLEQGSLDQRLKEEKQKLKKGEEIRSKLKKEGEALYEWSLLAEKIGDKEGKKFSRFAQTLTFQVLIDLANFHLKKFSPRYELVSNGNLHIQISDHYMGGKLRSSETLSGGETFLLSLSLALGLADLAEVKRPIETLFIDEGFGTLDEQSLEEALSALETLQSQSKKTIGMISHLAAVKERIPTRIQITQTAEGKSKLDVTYGSLR